MLVTDEELTTLRDKVLNSTDIESLRKRTVKMIEAFSQVNKLVGLYNKETETYKGIIEILKEIISEYASLIKEVRNDLEEEGNTLLSSRLVDALIETSESLFQ
jgi:hypothetical protein